MEVTYEKQSKALVEKIIRMRHRLLSEHKGVDHVQMRITLERVETSYKTYPHSSDSRMALFISNYCAELAYLIPSGNCPAGKTIMGELSQMVERSKPLLQRQNGTCVC